AVMLSSSTSRHSSSGALSIHWLCSGCGDSMPSIASACVAASMNAVSSHLFMSAALLRYAHFAEHAGFHVIEQVAMECPAAECVGAYQVAEHLAGLDADGVLAQQLPVAELDVAPHAVQVDGVVHHGVVDQVDAYALAVAQMQRLGIGKLDAVEAPHVAAHVAGQVQSDVALGVRSIWLMQGAHVGIGEHLATVIA